MERLLLPSMLSAVLAIGAGCDGSRGAAARVWVSNEDSQDVTVLDAATDAVLARIPVGKRPRGVRASRDGRWVFVALSGSPKAPPGVDERTLPPPDRTADGIAVIDTSTMTVQRMLPSGPDPEAFDVDAAGKTLWISNEETAEVSRVDIAQGRVLSTVPVGVEPEGVALSPDGRFVYVTCEREDYVAVVDTAANAVVARPPTAGRPRGVAFTPDGSRAFVTNEIGASVTAIDARTHATIADVDLGKDREPRPRPMGIGVSRDGKSVWVSTGRGGALAVIDAATLQVTRAVPGVGKRPWGLALTPDGKKAYVATGPSNAVAVVDTTSGAVLRTVAAGDSPWGVAITEGRR